MLKTSNSFHLKSYIPSFVTGQEEKHRILLFGQPTYSPSLLLHYNLQTAFLNGKQKQITQYELSLIWPVLHQTKPQKILSKLQKQ
jgi:hypothetical protein